MWISNTPTPAFARVTALEMRLVISGTQNPPPARGVGPTVGGICACIMRMGGVKCMCRQVFCRWGVETRTTSVEM